MHSLTSFRSYGLLTEDKVQWLKDNTPSIDSSHDTLAQHREPHDIIDHFASADPHPKKAYTPWMINRYKEGDFRQEDHPRITSALSNFEKYKGKLDNKDINSYKHLSDVEDAVEPHLGTASSGKEEKRIAKEEGAERVHEGSDGLKVTKVTSHGAACQYGAGTKWCTAGKSPGMFENYSKQGPLYVVNTPDARKYQFHFESSQFMNEKDQPEKLDKLKKKYPGLGDVEAFRDKHPAFDTKEGIISKAFNDQKYPGGKDAIEADAELSHPALTSDHIRKLYDSGVGSHHFMGGHPGTPPDVLDKMAEDPGLHYSIAGNPNLSSRGFRRIVDTTDPKTSNSIHTYLLGNPNARSEDLDYLASKSDNPGTHMLISRHPHASQERLHEYAHGTDQILASNAIHNPGVSPETIRSIHSKGILQGAVASSPNTPDDVLHEIAGREGDSLTTRIPRNIALKNLQSRSKK